ncbi:hypothetical protein C8Q80DRAFT_1144656 [Daedaleopsis nitida]|nr:hypothetical protein C8Q80DRAFT_1144656 [Daedaleopsis nitida]
MNSPTDRASPALSDSSTDTPEIEVEELSRGANMSLLTDASTFHPLASSMGNPMATMLSGSSMAPKRRLPGGLMFGNVGGARDPKSRRKDVRGPGGGNGPWDGMMGGGRSQREELVDSQLVEQLRAQFGDPFDESALKKNAGDSA